MPTKAFVLLVQVLAATKISFLSICLDTGGFMASWLTHLAELLDFCYTMVKIIMGPM